MDLNFITKIAKGDDMTILKSFFIQSPFIYIVLFFYYAEFKNFELLPQIAFVACIDIFFLMCYRATLLWIRVLINRDLKLFISGLTGGTIVTSIALLFESSRYDSGLMTPALSYAIAYVVISIAEIFYAFCLSKELEMKEDNESNNIKSNRKKRRKSRKKRPNEINNHDD